MNANLEIPASGNVDANLIASVNSIQKRPQRPSPLSASLTHAWRAMLKIKHVPWQMLDVTIFPILMTVMFTYVFGSALAGSIDVYVQQLVPGILVMTVAMISMYTAVGLNNDITKGIFDRFRALSFWRPAVLVGALLGDVMRYSVASVVVIVLGVLLGFRPEAGVVGVVSATLLVLVFAFSLSWIWTTIGLLVDNPETVSVISSLTTFPLTFVSNVFVDPATMPEFLRGFVEINPISLTAKAARGLMHGTATSTDIVLVLIACVALIAIFAPLSMYLYNNKNAR